MVGPLGQVTGEIVIEGFIRLSLGVDTKKEPPAQRTGGSLVDE